MDIDEYIQRRGFYEPQDMAVGVVMILLVMETTRRAVGWVMDDQYKDGQGIVRLTRAGL
jgi:TRAP-type uncharacterized transport system fused permease subunit